jgi:hypothetical protein
VTLVAAVVLAAAGCSGNGEPRASADTTGTTVPADDTASEPTTTLPAPAGDTTHATNTTTPPADECAETATWGTEPQGADPMTIEDVYLVRPGRHDCYDRVVFDVNGVVDGPDSVGFHVAYVPGDVLADASGEPVPTAGDAALEVVVRGPAQGYGTTGHQPWRTPDQVGDDLVTTDQVAGWPVLREVTFAGSFEGQATFAVGVDRQLPFRAGAYEADGFTHVYVDIAHAG